MQRAKFYQQFLSTIRFYVYFKRSLLFMRHEDLLYVLALQRTEGVGDVIAKRLISACGDAKSVFSTPIRQLATIDNVGALRLKGLKQRTQFLEAERELKYIQEFSLECSFFLDDNYPENLKHCPDAPLLVFTKGNCDLPKRKIISIVGTREVSAAGAEFCRQLIAGLAPLDPIIVSGLAYGVDIVAHNAALDNGLETVAVVAHGLDRVYPSRHKRYVPQILERGALVTEFWSQTEPVRENFIRRNRIVAGLADATIVIESADKGGSLITANFANDYNREVFAVPGRPTDKYSAGCNNLIKTQRAHALTSAADLLYVMNWQTGYKPKAIQRQLFVTLEPSEQQIYDYLQPRQRLLLDTIAYECNLPVSLVSSLLLRMELKGVIRAVAGKMFEVV
jgi:DNA processing protein